MKILNKFKFSKDFKETFIKDCSIEVFKKKMPEFESLVEMMKETLPSGYKHYLVDFIVQNCKVGTRTCRDTRYHFDGDFNSNNEYVIWVKGPNRTRFPEDHPVFEEIPKERNDQNNFLEDKLKGKNSIELPDQTFVRYSSKDPHKGVICTEEGKRIFVRLMASDYIKPKNIFKERNNA